ncbi:NAD(P)-binding domain-containing protein [Citricoccus sp. K5]|uniref:RraA family protein n=1 Tax=Citricoccus sp. K5 TaxID=2653135 RepID=UPI0012EFFCCD|nr:NAD binding domain of 6-phosphogluconate dehydrogenase family protein [Citricoccus sp. K5]
MRVAVLGLGEAGRTFAEGFARTGHEVSGYDPAEVAVNPSVHRRPSIAQAVDGAEVVLSLTTAAHAVAAAQEAAPHLGRDAVYIDLNSGSPRLKEQVRDALSGTGEPGAEVVDGAVIGSVRRFGERVQVLLAGPAAEEARRRLVELGGNPETVGTDLGAASSRKLLRSVFMKGLGALVSESMDAADRAGESDWMGEQIAVALADGDAGRDRLRSGTMLHAARRGRELADSLTGLDGPASDWPVTSGAREYHLRAARTSDGDLVERLAAIPTAALGDAGDRLGLMTSRIKPVWEAPAVAGRALTVWTRPGDNAAVHRALDAARAGDILVVAAGGHAERALMGELIAERAVSKGIRAFITDGAVRDARELAEIGFPVWAAGISPAGPYKDGPGRTEVPVSIGGVVCQPGDYVVADSDGVIVVPSAEVESVLRRGQAVLADEERRRDEILRRRGKAGS